MPNTMHQDSKASRCLRVLQDGPATTGEVAQETGLPVALVCTHLKNLFHRGKVRREPFRKPYLPRGGRRNVWMWRLPT